MKEKLLSILLSNINLEGIVSNLLDEVLEESLLKVVADTSTPFDDMLMTTVYPVLEKELKNLLADKLAKLNE